MKICSKCNNEKVDTEFKIIKNKLDSWCKQCYANKAKEYYNLNKDKVKSYRQSDRHKELKSGWDKKYRDSNKELIKSRKKEYWEKNKEELSLKAKGRYASNPGPFKKRAREWVANNRELHNARCMERYAMKMSRCPSWAKELTALACEEAYDKAKRLQALTGVPHDVDHIVPLKGRTVSGLHVYSNLQVLPASLNRSKKHLWWPDMWEAA